jgi:glycosyltransferase involved in cell wall biosynthesis
MINGPKVTLNILQVCLSTSWGGLEMSALKMTKYFSDRGHRSFCLCKKRSELHRNLHKNGVPHFSLNIHSHYSPWNMFKIRRLIKKNGINVVHSHFLRDLWLLSPALCGLPQIEFFATCHMLFSRIKKKDWGHRLIYRRLRKIIALTWIAREFHLKCLPLSPEDMVVIPNGVDLSRFSPEKYSRNSIRNEFMIKGDEPLVGLIGRLDQSKGQEELVYAAREVVKEFPACKFLIVGEKTKGGGKGFLNKIQNLIKELHLQDNIIMTGFRTDTPEILKALDIFVFPSYKETFGISLLEAMAMTIPIVATNSGGVPEILDHGKCAILIPPREAPPLAEAIKRYLSNPGFAEKMALKARKRVEEEYDLNLVLDKIEQLYLNSLDYPFKDLLKK